MADEKKDESILNKLAKKVDNFLNKEAKKKKCCCEDKCK